jgi:hypothetical protein
VGAIAGGPHPTQQARFGATLQGCEQGQGSISLERVAEGST